MADGLGPGTYGYSAYGTGPYGGGEGTHPPPPPPPPPPWPCQLGAGAYGYSAYGTAPYGGSEGTSAQPGRPDVHLVGLGTPIATGRRSDHEAVGLGAIDGFGQRRPAPLEAVGLGALMARGRRSDFDVVGLGAPTGVGRRKADEMFGFGTIDGFGQRRAATLEAIGLGALMARGRRSDFDLVGFGTTTAAGRKTAYELIGLGALEGSGQRSKPPEAAAFGVIDGAGARRALPELIGLGSTDAVGSRESTGPSELVGIGDMGVPGIAHPEMAGLGAIVASGQRLFRRRYLAPGWLKIRERVLEEWTSEPPETEPPLALDLVAESSWYGPFDWGTYTANFFPGEGYGQQLIPLSPTEALFVYRYNATWFPPVDSPYYQGGSARSAQPIAGRKLTLDPATGIVTDGPEVLLASHPLVEGPGDNDTQFNDPWESYPRYWSVCLVSTTATTTKLLLRLYDDNGFYDPFPGRPYLFNGLAYKDWGYQSVGLVQIDVDWTAGTAAHGPFHRLGGPVGLTEAWWGQDLALVNEAYHENGGEYEFWGWMEGEGDVLVITRMLTATRGVTAYVNTREDYQLIITSFDLGVGGVITELDTYAFPNRSVSSDGVVYVNSNARLLRLSATRFAVLAATDPVVNTPIPGCWSFSVDAGGLITLVGRGTDLATKTYPDYMGGEVVGSEYALFYEANQANGWDGGLSRVHVPVAGPPTFAPVLTSVQLAHPDQQAGFFYDWALTSDGNGHWIAVWTSWVVGFSGRRMFARAGRFVSGSSELLDAIQLIPGPGSTFAYGEAWWGAWMSPNHMLYGWLSNTGVYSIRTVALKLTGGSGGL